MAQIWTQLFHDAEAVETNLNQAAQVAAAVDYGGVAVHAVR